MSAARRDALICVVAVAALLLLAAHFDLVDRWHAVTRAHEDWELDELLPGFALGAFGVAWLAYRRWRQSRREVRRNRSLNRDLRAEIALRETAETSLKRSETRLEAAARSANLGIYVWDLEADRCVYCSEEYARIHGMSVAEYQSRSASIVEDNLLIHPDDRERVLAFHRSVDVLEPMSIEHRIVLEDGSIRTIRDVEHSIEVRDGRVVRVEGTVQDITELKRAESLLAHALDTSPMTFVLYDAEDRLLASNSQFRKMADIGTLPAVPGTRFEDMVHAFAEAYGIGGSAEATEAWVRQRLDRRNQPAHQYQYERNDGEWIEVTDILLEDGQVFTISRHVTETKKMEAQLRQAQKMEAVGQLTGGLAHDFNNLLAIVRAQAEALAERGDADRFLVGSILKATERGGELTRRLLAVAREQPLAPRRISLAELAGGMAELLERTLGPGIETQVVAAPDLWPALADPGQVENALLNLALNARNAMPGGGRLTIELSNARLEHGDKPSEVEVQTGDYVLLAVSDTGVGMTPEVRARAFEPFFTTRHGGEGTGLGLSMIYGFARQSGGHLELHSELGAGTSVQLYLPRAQEDEAPPEGAPESAPGQAANGGDTGTRTDTVPDSLARPSGRC